MGVSKNTIYQCLRKGELPGRKDGGKWVIRSVDLESITVCAGCKSAYNRGTVVCLSCGVLPGKWEVLGTVAALIVVLMIAVGIFFAATMDAPGKLVALAYATAVPGIILAALLIARVFFRPLRLGSLLAGPAIMTFAISPWLPIVGLIGIGSIWFSGVSIGGWGWPANVWLDIYSPDTVIRALVDEKEVENHTHCSSSQYGGRSCRDESHYYIHAGGRRWGVNESTYQVIRQGERVEIGFRPRTHEASYIAYNLAEGDKIRVSVSLAPSERNVFEDAILPEFKRSTGVSVEFVQIESAELLSLLREEGGGAGVIFDLLVIDNNSLAPLVAEGLVEDLTQETHRVPDEVLDSMLPVTQFGGGTFFFPFRPNVQITFYNSEKFGEMSIEPPRTWDELIASARTMKETEGKGRLALKGVIGGPNGVQVTEFIWQAGGDPLVLDDIGSHRAFEFLKELAPYLSDRTGEAKFDTMNDYLARGDVYVGQNWAFGVQEIVVKNGKREIQAYSGWSGPEGEVHVLGGDVLAGPKGAANRTDALAFAEYLMSKAVQSTLAAELAWPSIRGDAYDGVDPALKPYWDAINEAMSKAQARPNVPYWPEVEQILGLAWTDIVMNGRDVQQRLNFYASEIEKARQAAPSVQLPARTGSEPTPQPEEPSQGDELSRERCGELIDVKP